MRIMVPLDGSDFAEAALPVAATLARAASADIVLIAVGDLPESSTDALAIRTELQERIQRGRAKIPDITVHALVEMNDNPAAVIAQAAETQGIDIIVMATHGRGGVSRLLQGSVASDVVRRCPVPVTLVRPDAVRESERQADGATG
jgi:nucleotide-binding universal stress UspA family protein